MDIKYVGLENELSETAISQIELFAEQYDHLWDRIYIRFDNEFLLFQDVENFTEEHEQSRLEAKRIRDEYFPSTRTKEETK